MPADELFVVNNKYKCKKLQFIHNVNGDGSSLLC